MKNNIVSKIENFVTNFNGLMTDYNGETANINMALDNFTEAECEYLMLHSNGLVFENLKKIQEINVYEDVVQINVKC